MEFNVILQSPDFAQVWTPVQDVVIDRVSLEGGSNMDAVVSEDPAFDLGNFATVSATFAGVIALFSVNGNQFPSRAPGYPVGAGSNVYFLADAFCLICLSYHLS